MSTHELNTFLQYNKLTCARVKDASAEVGGPILPLQLEAMDRASEKTCQLLTQDQECSEINQILQLPCNPKSFKYLEMAKDENKLYYCNFKLQSF